MILKRIGSVIGARFLFRISSNSNQRDSGSQSGRPTEGTRFFTEVEDEGVDFCLTKPSPLFCLTKAGLSQGCKGTPLGIKNNDALLRGEGFFCSFFASLSPSPSPSVLGRTLSGECPDFLEYSSLYFSKLRFVTTMSLPSRSTVTRCVTANLDSFENTSDPRSDSSSDHLLTG